MVVVAVRPLKQRQYVGGQQWFVIQHRQRRPQQRRVQGAVGPQFDQKPDGLSPAEWHAHPHAGTQSRQIAIQRRQIIKRLIKRGWNGDSQNRAGHGG